MVEASNKIMDVEKTALSRLSPASPSDVVILGMTGAAGRSGTKTDAVPWPAADVKGLSPDLVALLERAQLSDDCGAALQARLGVRTLQQALLPLLSALGEPQLQQASWRARRASRRARRLR